MTHTPKSQHSITVDQALQQAVAHHQAGRLQEAERLYRAILQTLPKHPDANHNLGVLAVQVKQPAAALPHFKTALEANPDQGQYWLSYTEALIQAGQIDVAKQVLEQGQRRGLQGQAVSVLAQRLESIKQLSTQSSTSPLQRVEAATTVIPATPPNLEKFKSEAQKLTLARESQPIRIGQQEKDVLASLFGQGRYMEVEPLARAMTENCPQDGFGWMLLGALYKQMGRSREALTPMQKAVELSPEAAEAHYNLGTAFKELGRLEEAVGSYRRALIIHPDFAEANNNLGTALKELGQLDEAEDSYRRAIRSKSGYVEAHNNLGNILGALTRFEEAEASFRQALQLRPSFAEAHYNLGAALKVLGRLEEAEASYQIL